MPYIIDIPKIEDCRGDLAVLTHSGVVPFEIVRTYWLSGISQVTVEGGISYYKNQEFLVALSGEIEIEAESVDGVKTFRLDRPDRGLYIPPLTWRRVYSRSNNAAVVVVASELADRSDALDDYSQFQNLIKR